MTEVGRPRDYLDYRDAAAAVFGRYDGLAAVDAFGLHDVFDDVAGDADLTPAYAFLEAQGRRCAATPALALLGPAGKPFGLGKRVLLGSPLGRTRLVAVPGLVPDAAEGVTVAADLPGTGLVDVLDWPAATRARPQPSADRYLTVVDVDQAVTATLVPERDLDGLRAVMRARTQLGAAAELLGLVDRLLEDAVTYAGQRRQFGHPLSGYQAVQHILAWAATERHQLVCLYDIAVARSADGSVQAALCEAVKALAGRVFHAVVQAASQVTGAISFTWEYSLNRLHHRGLGLDQLAGSSAELTAELARRVRADGVLPPFVELYDL